MANRTLVEKAAEKVGYGLAMAEDLAGTVKTAIGSVAEGLKKSPPEQEATAGNKTAKAQPTTQAANKPARNSAAKKSAAKKPAGKKSAAKKSVAKKSVARKSVAKKSVPKKTAKKASKSRRESHR